MARGGKRAGAGRPRKKEAPPQPEKPKFRVLEGAAGEPGEPDWSLIYSDELDVEFARHQWGVVIRTLKDAEKLDTANAHQIKRLVCAYVLFEQAARHVAEDGAVVVKKGRRGGPKMNDWFQVMKDANAMASAAEAELTITPRRRSNGGKVTKKPKAAGGAAAYLQPVAGRSGHPLGPGR